MQQRSGWWSPCLALALLAAVATACGSSGSSSRADPGGSTSTSAPSSSVADPPGDSSAESQGALSAEERADAFEQSLVPAGSSSGVELATRMEDLSVPGVAVAVVEAGAVEWVRGYGVTSVEDVGSVTADTLFQAASISKPVTALVVLDLVDDGILDLDLDIADYLTSWAVPPSDEAGPTPITLRSLLSHTAGLTVGGFLGYDRAQEPPTLPEVLDGIGNSDPVQVVAPVGSSYSYSGGGFVIVQQIIEDVTGRPFADVARARVLVPLGMDASTFEQPLPEPRLDEIASGHVDDEPLAGRFHVHPEQTAAGLWTTAGDLAEFVIGVQEVAGGERSEPASAFLVDEMLSPQVVGVETVGLAWFLDDATSPTWFRHFGANLGYQSFVSGSVEGRRGVVVLTNTFGSGDRLASEIANAVADVYRWVDSPVVPA